MRADLQSLYRETLIEQSRNPKNNYAIEGANRQSELKNPLCGDVVTIYLSVSGGRIEEASFEAQCCSICRASASMLTTRIAGSDSLSAISLAEALVAFLNAPESGIFDKDDSRGKLSKRPSRIKRLSNKSECVSFRPKWA